MQTVTNRPFLLKPPKQQTQSKKNCCSDTQSSEEEELVANLFDCLSACLMLPANKAVFVEAEGLELMLLVLKVGGWWVGVGGRSCSCCW